MAVAGLAACGGQEKVADSPARVVRPLREAPVVQPRGPAAPEVVPVVAAAPAPVAAPKPAAEPKPVAVETAERIEVPQPVLLPAEDAEEAQSAAEILRRTEARADGIRTLEADFVQSVRVPLLNQTQNSAGRLFQRKPDRFLMRFSQPAGDVMVADGRYFWLYYPSSDRTQVIRTSIAKGGGSVDLQRQFIGNATARFVPTLNRSETVDGHDTHVLTLVPRQASPYRILRIWVDKRDFTVRRFETTEENESVRRVELRNIRVNQPIADNVFVFTPPRGTQVFDQ
jgi:outer membrane lipoprotein carrier protein